jgi:hypothetical protein
VLQPGMRPIAKRPIPRLLAPAKKHRPRLAALVFQRRQAGALVAAVAERLAGAAPARAPVLTLPCLNLHLIRALLCNHCIRHLLFPPLCIIAGPPLINEALRSKLDELTMFIFTPRGNRQWVLDNSADVRH